VNDGTYGVGIEYDVGNSDRFVYRVEIAHHQVGKNNVGIQSVSLGIIYIFP